MSEVIFGCDKCRDLYDKYVVVRKELAYARAEADKFRKYWRGATARLGELQRAMDGEEPDILYIL